MNPGARRLRCDADRQAPAGRSRSGITLLETLVWMSIVAVMGSIVYVFFHRSCQIVRKGDAFLQAQGEMDIAMTHILRDIRAARAVTPRPGVVPGESDLLALEVPAIDAEGRVTPGGFDSVTYESRTDITSGIYRTVEAHPSSSRPAGRRRIGPAQLAAAFRCDPPGARAPALVTVTVRAPGEPFGRKEDIKVSATALMRNAGPGRTAR